MLPSWLKPRRTRTPRRRSRVQRDTSGDAPAFAEWLREDLKALSAKIDGINSRLDKLNGSVARNVERIEENKKAIALVAEHVDGFELKGALDAKYREGTMALPKAALSWITRDDTLLKLGMAGLLALVGADLAGLFK